MRRGRRTGLAGGVESQHQQAHLFRAKHLGLSSVSVEFLSAIPRLLPSAGVVRKVYRTIILEICPDAGQPSIPNHAIEVQRTSHLDVCVLLSSRFGCKTPYDQSFDSRMISTMTVLGRPHPLRLLAVSLNPIFRVQQILAKMSVGRSSGFGRQWYPARSRSEVAVVCAAANVMISGQNKVDGSKRRRPRSQKLAAD